MAEPMTYSAITRGIEVSVEPTYLEARSLPHESQYFWAYRIVIHNKGTKTVQLISRHWRIMNAIGTVREVKGEGVIGKQPVLKPGESHEYSSGTPLNTPSGLMTGTYQMKAESGEVFDIEIPSFSLDSPHNKAFMH